MKTPDIRALIGEVAARHGIRLDADDPAFAIVTLNVLMLEEVLTEAFDKMEKLPRDWEVAAARVQGQSGERIAADTRTALQAIAQEKAKAAGAIPASRVAEKNNYVVWIAVGVLSGLLLLILGYVLGKAT